MKLQCNYTATAKQGGIILYGGHGCLKINKHSFCTRLGLRDGPCMHFLEKMRKMVGTTQHLTNKDFAWGLVPKATIYAVLDGDAPVVSRRHGMPSESTLITYQFRVMRLVVGPTQNGSAYPLYCRKQDIAFHFNHIPSMNRRKPCEVALKFTRLHKWHGQWASSTRTFFKKSIYYF